MATSTAQKTGLEAGLERRVRRRRSRPQQVGLRHRQRLLRLQEPRLDRRLGQRGTAVLHARAATTSRQGQPADHPRGEGVAARLRLHLGAAEDAQARRHAAVHQAVRRVRVPRQGALGQGPVAGAVDAAAGRHATAAGRPRGEIDLMEIVGEKPHEVLEQHPLRLGLPQALAGHPVHELPDGSTVADWHIYAVEWEPGEIRFCVDGVQTCTYDHWWSCSRLEDGAGVEARQRGRPQPLAGAFRPAVLPGDERRRRRQLPRRAERGRRSSRPNWWWTTCASTTRSAATASPSRIGKGKLPWQKKQA